MATNHIELRTKRYFNLSSQIAQLDNAQLHSLFDNSESNESSTGWGTNHTIVFGQSKVFVKRVPVTNIEYDNLFSTRNLYDLPTYCNYNVGSTSFGVFRELVTHIKTTNWVLEGASYYSCSENDKRRIMEKYGIKEGLQPYEVGSILLDNKERFLLPILSGYPESFRILKRV